jgi:hypothetical protein
MKVQKFNNLKLKELICVSKGHTHKSNIVQATFIYLLLGFRVGFKVLR